MSQGFAIGNGLTDPEIQYGAYADFALDMGLIGESTHKTISKIYPLCKLGIELCSKYLVQDLPFIVPPYAVSVK